MVLRTYMSDRIDNRKDGEMRVKVKGLMRSLGTHQRIYIWNICAKKGRNLLIYSKNVIHIPRPNATITATTTPPRTSAAVCPTVQNINHIIIKYKKMSLSNNNMFVIIIIYWGI